MKYESKGVSYKGASVSECLRGHYGEKRITEVS